MKVTIGVSVFYFYLWHSLIENQLDSDNEKEEQKKKEEEAAKKKAFDDEDKVDVEKLKK